MRTVISGAGLAAVLFGALVAPASAAPSQPNVDLSGAVATPGKAVTDLPSPKSLNAEGPNVCFRGHVQDIGWQQWNCDTDPDGAADAGTTGQNLRLEAIQIIARETGGLTCAQAHVQDIGWQGGEGEGQQCVEDGSVIEIGTVGRGLRIEAIFFGSTVLRTCSEAHVQEIGWMGQNCQAAGFGAIVGTTGKGLRLEAVRSTVRQKP
ncbi:hypothetical protein ABZ345_03200 [Lentzea sp. NPDC005914]|uniref:hypothetical protein n=1 Tax=Lentzea sp. NPDC005914 TaxID=3154572 RepID=UPI0033FAFEFD